MQVRDSSQKAFGMTFWDENDSLWRLTVQSVPDWLLLWRELVEAQARGRAKAKVDAHPDVWRAKAREFHEAVQRRWSLPDSSRDFIAADLEQHPGDTVLDIGAGTGAWAVFLAQRARRVVRGSG